MTAALSPDSSAVGGEEGGERGGGRTPRIGIMPGPSMGPESLETGDMGGDAMAFPAGVKGAVRC